MQKRNDKSFTHFTGDIISNLTGWTVMLTYAMSLSLNAPGTFIFLSGLSVDLALPAAGLDHHLLINIPRVKSN